jgi:hypothetical protein
VVKRWGIIAIICFVLLAGWIALHLAVNREPRYQGRTLSQWLKMHVDASDSNEARVRATLNVSSNAVQQIGGNAIPFLLGKFLVTDTPLKLRLKKLVGSQSLIRVEFTNPVLERSEAVQGFWILRENATSAATALAELTSHPDWRVRLSALDSLSFIHAAPETILPVFMRMIHDSDRQVQMKASYYFGKIFPEEAGRAGVFRQYPGFRPTSTNNVSFKEDAGNK